MKKAFLNLLQFLKYVFLILAIFLIWETIGVIHELAKYLVNLPLK